MTTQQTKTENISFRINEKSKSNLVELAQQRGISLTDICTEILNNYQKKIPNEISDLEMMDENMQNTFILAIHHLQIAEEMLIDCKCNMQEILDDTIKIDDNDCLVNSFGSGKKIAGFSKALINLSCTIKAIKKIDISAKTTNIIQNFDNTINHQNHAKN